MRAPAKQQRRVGFTLLEVMVAMAILAISLGGVFATESGAIRMAARARKMGFASLLVRCKMGEIEEQIFKEGFPAVFDEGTDNCCKEAPIEGFSCKWEIEPVTMPDTMFGGEDEESGGTGSDSKDAKGATAATKTGDLEGAKKKLDELDKDKDKDPSKKKDDKKLDPSELMKDPSKLLSGTGMGGEEEGSEGSSGGGLDAIASMAMGYVYPILKPSFESQIRRATVTVVWSEGEADKSFDVTQYLVAEQPIRLPDGTDPNQNPANTPLTGAPTGNTSSGSGLNSSSTTGSSSGGGINNSMFAPRTGL